VDYNGINDSIIVTNLWIGDTILILVANILVTNVTKMFKITRKNTNFYNFGDTNFLVTSYPQLNP